MTIFRVEDMTGHHLRRAQQRHAEIWTAVIGDHLSSAQYSLLEACHILDAKDLPVDQSLAGKTAGIDRSTTAEMITRLVKQRWLTSEKNPNDRRRQLLRLTAPAMAALAWCEPLVDRVQVQLMSPLTAEEQAWLLPRWERLAAIPAAVDQGARGQVVHARNDHGHDIAHGESTGMKTDLGKALAFQSNPGRKLTDSGARPPQPGHLLRRAQQRHLQLWTAKVSTRWTSQQFALLDAAGQAGPGGAAQNELGDTAGIDRSSTSHLVTKLVGQRLLERRPDPADARRRLVALTKAGREIYTDLAAAAVTLQKTLLSPLNPEDRQPTRDLLRRIAAA